MKRTIFKVHAVLLGVLLMIFPIIRVECRTSVALPQQRYSDEELDELFAPIALYPDPLLAQVIPAATFIDELRDAQRQLGGRSDDNVIANQSWDVSVKSVAHYPQVLQRMVEKEDWTTAIGQAYVNQSTDVGKSIQRLRAEAKAAGNLVTTSQMQVISEGQVIKIVPAQPQVIYVPQYNPEVVYVNSGPSTGAVIAAAAITFGVGLAIGEWLNNDWDWYGRGIFYHGWRGGGWIGVNRTFVNINRNVYINNRYRNVNINRTVVNRNINSYRTTLNRNATVRRQNITRNNVNRNDINRRDVNRNDINREALNRNNAGRNEALRNRAENSSRLNDFRGRDTQNAANRRDSNSVFGGGGNRNEIREQRDRGSNSINRMNTDRGAGRLGGGDGGQRKLGGERNLGGGLRRGRRG
jgi:Protein of unknown function (DUF3300)